MPARLLLISCSERKRATRTPVQARRLYTGVFYQVIASARRDQHMPRDMHVGIISAEHGFLEEHDRLLPYERKMTPKRARALQPVIAQRLDAFLRQIKPEMVLVAMGFTYRLSLANSQELARLNEQGQVLWAHEEAKAPGKSGGIGDQLRYVHKWLYAEAVPSTYENTLFAALSDPS